jgi:hypothetical protein
MPNVHVHPPECRNRTMAFVARQVRRWKEKCVLKLSQIDHDLVLSYWYGYDTVVMVMAIIS